MRKSYTDSTSNVGSRAESNRSRRRVLQSIGGVSAAGIAGLAGCLGGGSSDPFVVQVTGGNYIDSYESEVFSAFEEEQGVDVAVNQISDQFDGYNQIQSGQSDAHVTITSANTLYMGASEGVWEPINTDDLDNYDSLAETFKNPVYDAGDDVHGIPTVYGTIGMAYNRDEMGELDSWEACWDQANAGNVTMQGTDFVRVFTTALHLGMDPNDIGAESSYEDGIQQIWDSVREQKELISSYWSTGDEHVRMYAQNEAYVGEAWGGRIKAAVDDGHDHLDYVIPKEGAYGWSDNWAMVSGIDDDKRSTAMDFFDFLLTEDVLVPLAEALGYPPATGATSDVIENLGDYDPTGGERLTFMDPGYQEDHSDEWSQEWERIQSS
ncbi:ABC transporter substrate-binding protein [Natrinema marinum]|uniref:ABC transporter substrate-binding protein n=1 Tax=Natrinema marinum TaxID=2961598 RepID=UPI0020C88C90|nr:extracellular solute-binding protein [Natrinema marinum]